jgi:hypothetical protein
MCDSLSTILVKESRPSLPQHPRESPRQHLLDLLHLGFHLPHPALCGGEDLPNVQVLSSSSLVSLSLSLSLTSLSDVEESSMSVELTDAARAKQAKLNSLSFLYESYQPRYWWWEIAETSQRLILTGVLVLIAQGSAFQIIVGAMLSLLFLHLNARYEPFSDGFVLSIKIVSYWQIFFVFWIALLIKADFPSIGSLSLGVCLIITIFMNIFLDLWKVCWAAVSSSRRARWSSSRSRELRDENDTEPERGVRLASHTEMRAMSAEDNPCSPLHPLPSRMEGSETGSPPGGCADL